MDLRKGRKSFRILDFDDSGRIYLYCFNFFLEGDDDNMCEILKIIAAYNCYCFVECARVGFIFFFKYKAECANDFHELDFTFGTFGIIYVVKNYENESTEIFT